jgi:hypothetical protein
MRIAAPAFITPIQGQRIPEGALVSPWVHFQGRRLLMATGCRECVAPTVALQQPESSVGSLLTACCTWCIIIPALVLQEIRV